MCLFRLTLITEGLHKKWFWLRVSQEVLQRSAMFIAGESYKFETQPIPSVCG